MALRRYGRLSEASRHRFALPGSANAHMQEFPNDSDAYWYQARAYLLKKERAKALTDLNQTAFLAPNWKAEYTDPLIAEVRLREKAKGH